ncbi:Protein of unknown function (DUF1645 [Striga hermonthica]|uniref:Uncharacterized protein n=1 Tax=Striga hermonthica TaxID=68872 RepID=A0A9N7N5T4_STRHE|nr:Protein of unknown function (DUF1645 [Striga hermonthica]
MNNNCQDNDAYVCPSFSSYSSDRLAETAERSAGDDDFEFSLVREDGENLIDGQIRQVFPVFNRDLLDSSESSVAVPLSRLFIEEDRERDCPPSCSSSEADELENVPSGTYCVWRPRMPSQCRKSKSTGSASRRWNLRDLLRRSKSDGMDSFVFLTRNRNKEGKAVKSTEHRPPASAHETFYVRNKAAKEVNKKKSYLPYRPELVGFFANVNGSSARC